jgi:hypothetical protein
MQRVLKVSLIAGLLALAGCVTVPTGPSVMALPGTGKNFDQFRFDDGTCRQFAHEQVGGATTDTVAQDSGAKSAAVGTLLGAALGAAIDGGHGAAVGAGAGLAAGGLAGTGAAEASSYGLQRRYDNAYVQCMYAKGHRVPVAGRYSYSSAPRYAPPPSQPAAPAVPPPPPAGAPPPPPPYGSSPPR